MKKLRGLPAAALVKVEAFILGRINKNIFSDGAGNDDLGFRKKFRNIKLVYEISNHQEVLEQHYSS